MVAMWSGFSLAVLLTAAVDGLPQFGRLTGRCELRRAFAGCRAACSTISRKAGRVRADQSASGHGTLCGRRRQLDFDRNRCFRPKLRLPCRKKLGTGHPGRPEGLTFSPSARGAQREARAASLRLPLNATVRCRSVRPADARIAEAVPCDLVLAIDVAQVDEQGRLHGGFQTVEIQRPEFVPFRYDHQSSASAAAS